MTSITQPSIATHVSNGFAQGPQFTGNKGKIWAYDSSISNLQQTTFNSSTPVVPGSINSPVRVYDIKPQPASFNNMAAAQTLLANGNFQLVTTSGNGVIVTSFANQFAVQTDVPRALQITGVAGTTATNITLQGVDDEGYYFTEFLAGPVGATTVVTKKCYAYLLSATVSANTTQNISIGFADVFALPYVADTSNYITPMWGGLPDNIVKTGYFGTTVAMTAATPLVVANSVVNSNSIIMVSQNTNGGTPSALSAPQASIIPGVSFTVTANGALDTSTVNYTILQPGSNVGTATMVAASSSVVITNPLVTTSSVILVCYNTFGTGTEGRLSITNQAAGTFTVASQGGVNDNSTINYWILPTSIFSGTSTLVGGTVTVTSPYSYIRNTANTKTVILASAKTNGGTPGILQAPVASVSNATSFVVSSANGADTSTVNWVMFNASAPGTFTRADATSPAVINGGNVRPTYAPSSPSDGVKRLTVWMYVRGTDPIANYIGTMTNDTTLQSTDVNLYGVDQYYSLA